MKNHHVRAWLADLIYEEIARRGARHLEDSKPHITTKIPAQPEAAWIESVTLEDDDAVHLQLVGGEQFTITVSS